MIKRLFQIPAFALGLFAQTPLVRTPPDPPMPDLSGLQRILESAGPAAAIAGGKSGAPVPKDFKAGGDIPLPPTAAAAVAVSQQYNAQSDIPAPGADGRVLYAYGAGQATVVCAPLRICIIELQQGEKFVGDPQIGDAVRWHVTPATYGEGADTTGLVVVKPVMPGLDTNLLITTDRRAYYLRLMSKPTDYVSRLAFSYPDEDSPRWQRHLVEQQVAARPDAATIQPAIAKLERLNFDYRITGGTEHIRPVRVFDDGAKTYMQMPPSMEHRVAPVLLVLGPDGKGTMTNYRVQGLTYVVDRLFDNAQLVVGVGKRAKKVAITKSEPKG
jgi:type IV secretion system protein VirB9